MARGQGRLGYPTAHSSLMTAPARGEIWSVRLPGKPEDISSNNVELNYSYSGALNVGLGYSKTSNSFQEIATLNQQITSVTNYNVGYEKRLYMNFSLGMPITKWWNNYINLSPHYKKFTGAIQQGSLDNNAWGMGWYTSQSFNLPKKIKLQVSSWGSIATRNAMSKTAWLGSVDAGVAKSVLKSTLNDLSKASKKYSVRSPVIFWSIGGGMT